MDVFNAHNSVAEVISQIERLRDDEEVFLMLYNHMATMTTLQVPRLASRQTLRANPDVEGVEMYIRVSYYLPYVDMLMADLKRRFTSSPLLVSGKNC